MSSPPELTLRRQCAGRCGTVIAYVLEPGPFAPDLHSDGLIAYQDGHLCPRASPSSRRRSRPDARRSLPRSSATAEAQPREPAAATVTRGQAGGVRSAACTPSPRASERAAPAEAEAEIEIENVASPVPAGAFG